MSDCFTPRSHKRLTVLVSALALVGATALITNRVVSQDTKKDEHKMGGVQGKDAAAEHDAMMEKMQKLAAPGPQHKELQAMAGNWQCKSKMWHGPGEPTETAATATFKPVLGGRFILQEYTCSDPKMPFTGMGFIGYDNVTKQYVSSWCDSMSTDIMISHGKADASGKVVTYTGEYDCPMMGHTKYRHVFRNVSNSQCVFEMFNTGDDGKEAKGMEITYTRK